MAQMQYMVPMLRMYFWRMIYAKKNENTHWQQGLEKGIKEGKIEGILELLAENGSVSEELREKIFAQDNVDQLGKWLKLAARTNSIDEFIEKMNR